MNLISQAAASKIDYAPSAPGINKKLKSENPPGFFVRQNKKFYVDIDHPDWKELIATRKDRALRGTQQGISLGNRKRAIERIRKQTDAARKNQPSQSQSEPETDPPVSPPQSEPTPITPEYESILEQAQIAKMMEPILKSQELEQKVEMRKLQLKKQASELIEYQLAEFLFFGYLERVNMELLGITKKLAPTIHNLVKEKKPDAILKLFDREFEKILIEVKTSQKGDVKKWKEEN